MGKIIGMPIGHYKSRETVTGGNEFHDEKFLLAQEKCNCMGAIARGIQFMSLHQMQAVNRVVQMLRSNYRITFEEDTLLFTADEDN